MTDATPSQILLNPSLMESTTREITSPAVCITLHNVLPMALTICETASDIVLTKLPTELSIEDTADEIAPTTCVKVSPSCLTNGISTLIKLDARDIPVPTIKIVAPNESIAGIAALREEPNSANITTNPPTTIPNVPIAIAPSFPVFASGVIAKANTETEPENAIIPFMFVCKL